MTPSASKEPSELQEERLAALRNAANLFGAIIARGRVRAALEQSEERFLRMAEATVQGVMIHHDGRVVDANPSLAAVLGLPLERIIGRNPCDFVAPQGRKAVRELLELDRHGISHTWFETLAFMAVSTTCG